MTNPPRRIHTRLIVLAASVASLTVLTILGGLTYMGVRVLTASNSHFAYTVLRCQRYTGEATAEFAVTNETSRTRSARLEVEYFNDSGERLGTDVLRVPAIGARDTVRVSLSSKVPGPGLLARCEIRNARLKQS